MSAEKDTAAPAVVAAADAAAAPTTASATTTAPAPAPATEVTPAAAAADAKPEAKVEEPAAAAAAADDSKATTTATPKAVETPLTKLSARLPEILKQADHGEMWGVELADPNTHVPTKIVLQKYLRANANDAAAAEKQLVAALQWRKKEDPLALVQKTYDEAKFAGLGYLTVHPDAATGKETIITWNIYGAVKDNKATFGNVQECVSLPNPLAQISLLPPLIAQILTRS
jgi:phosphatidylinositol transfer protein SFH5